jgi:hypothetical protein
MRIDYHILPIIILGLVVGLLLNGMSGAVVGLLLIGVVTQGRIIFHGIDLSKNGTALGYLIQNELMILLSCSCLLMMR